MNLAKPIRPYLLLAMALMFALSPASSVASVRARSNASDSQENRITQEVSKLLQDFLAAVPRGDDITVHPYGNMAVVNFRLVAHNQNNGTTETAYYRNTGTFLKRNGKWQVVAWQSTKVPPEGEKR